VFNLFLESGKSNFIVNLTLLLSFIAVYPKIESNELTVVVIGLISGLILGAFLYVVGVYVQQT
jgi:hypothetical protein